MRLTSVLTAHSSSPLMKRLRNLARLRRGLTLRNIYVGTQGQKTMVLVTPDAIKIAPARTSASRPKVVRGT